MTEVIEASFMKFAEVPYFTVSQRPVPVYMSERFLPDIKGVFSI